MKNRTGAIRRLARHKIAKLMLAAAFGLVLASSGCQTSWTPKPQCSAGWHAERAPSHQGHVWDCVADYGPGRVPS